MQRNFVFISAMFFSTLLAGCNNADTGNEPPRIHASADAVQPPLLGTIAPGFAVRQADGSEFRLDPLVLDKPVVLVFYRGGWCPYCNAQLLELRHIEAQLVDELGYELLFLSADSPATLSAGSQLPDARYTVLSDNDLNASSAYGIAFRVDDETVQRYREYGIDLEASSERDHHALPVPAVFVINASGNVAFHYVNVDYRQRISPDLLLAAARTSLDERDVRERQPTE